MLTSAGISPRTAEWMVTMIKLSLDWEDPLEEETVTHSSILAWRIPMDGGACWATVHGVTKN